ncbi:MAG: hypothetical protein KAX31_05635 [Thermoplasmata archaeon]|nr:hypothetical protein [Thermoplasmata archaeon]
MVMVRTAQEELRISKHHIWVSEDDKAYAAFMIHNLGSRDILLDKVTIRGVDCGWMRTSGRVVAVTGESIGTGDGARKTFSGALDYNLIVPGSLTITDGVEIFTDDGIGGLSNGATGTGEINYITGVYSLTFDSAPAGEPAAATITATYEYEEGLNHYYLVEPTDDVAGDFELTVDPASGNVYAHIGSVPVDLAGWDSTATDMPLKSSGRMLFFIEDPVNIGLHDVGTTISLTVFTTNAQWIIETNVEAAEIN